MQQASDPAVSSVAPPSGGGQDAIAELEALLREEAAALSRLDMAAIDVVSERKLQLLPQLQSIETANEDLARLARVRELAIRNQLLTVHARDTVGIDHRRCRTPGGHVLPTDPVARAAARVQGEPERVTCRLV